MRFQNSWLLVAGVSLLVAAIGLPYFLIAKIAENISLLYGFLVAGVLGMFLTFFGVKRALTRTICDAIPPDGLGETHAKMDNRLPPGTASSQPESWSDLLIERVQAMTAGLEVSWVLFNRGTLILLPKAVGDLQQIAIDYLRENGPVVPGTPLGDFSVCRIKKCPGWVVTSHDPNLNVYVAPEENAGDDDLRIGMYGRSKRELDANDPCVLHIEDTRTAS